MPRFSCLVVIVHCGWSAALAMVPLANADAIYKCGNGSDGIVYTDTPCKGGERLQIQPGAADPAALIRLQETRIALDRSADRRLAAQDVAVERAPMSWLPPYSEPPPAQDNDDYPYYGYGGYVPGWYAPRFRPRTHRQGPSVAAVGRFAPQPPYIVPRR